jgi:DNA mismatch repair protein MSH6
VSYAELSDDEEDVTLNSSLRKRRRVIDDDDEDDFVPDAKEESDDDVADFVVPDDFEDDQLVIEDDDDDFIELTKKKTTKSTPAKSTPSKLKQFTSGSEYKPSSKKNTPSKAKPAPKHQKFTKENEERYQWLVDIRDAEKRSINDPDYDPRTLYIPQSAWAKFTSFEKQYWEIKSKMWDCIVFFKKGKFYELYEKDAMIAHNEFDLKIAGGGRANMQLAGIPEMSFDYWATSFISKGYKVAKVDQKETGLAKEIRETGTKGKKDVIQRELKCVLTAGTLTEETMLVDDMAMYCCAVKEEIDPRNPSAKLFGVAFIDTATGAISLTEFSDDSECTKFETLISQLRPKEVIVAKNNLCSLAMRILKFNCQNQAIFNIIKSDQEFYDFDTTFETLTRGKYFPAENLDDLSQWPMTLREHYKSQKMTAFSAFGGLLWYLQSLKLDESLISLGNISGYTTIKPTTNLVLDGQTLQNLEIFANSFDGTDKGTLFKLVNRASTPFGKRLLQAWIVHPLLHKSDIEDRLDSVDQLLEDGDLKATIEVSLSKLPDLERLLSRVHAGQLKLKDFTRVIEGFEDINSLYKKLYGRELKGALAKLYNALPTELDGCLEKWSDAFDRVRAKENDVLILSSGVEDDYDESKNNIQRLEDELTIKLREYRREFKTQSIEYKDFGKELYTIEMPISIKVPSSWKQMGASKKTKRWWSPEVEELSKEIARAKELHKILEDSLKTRMFARFDTDYNVWSSAISAIAKIDCLVSLARTSESIGFPAVRPEFVDSNVGVLEFEELRHPFFNTGLTNARDFIPNSINLGGKHANLGLLTGANAAGKSTVLRMTCIAVILAQIGCYVPCESAKLTAVDRIMTRLGANDNIMQGKSTFFVELSETKRILENATPKSLLVLDELGRGGSSSDGFAIAEAVLHHVVTHIQSLGFFATHYASLGESFKHHPQVQPYRMSIIVDNESKNITFLYKLELGAAEGSFGMHVASMCGIDSQIIKRSEQAAEDFEHTSMLKKNVKENTSLIPLGLQSDFSKLMNKGLVNMDGGCGEGVLVYNEATKIGALKSIFSMIDGV